MKVLHYSSLTILTLFVLEVLIKIYVFGREFWNLNKRKMEYFDGLIVIISFIIDIYFLINENNYFMEYRFEMITTIRMWRMVRIINGKNFIVFIHSFHLSFSTGVAQCTISEEQKKKDRLNLQYILTIEQLIDVLKYKTTYIAKEYNKTEEYLTNIDNQCQSCFDTYKESTQQIASSDAMTQFCEQLEKLKMNF
jgi:hypothetical protein